MTTTDTEQVTCLCGCGGTNIGAKGWVRGHFSRGVGGYNGPALLPDPDDEFDLGDLEPDPEPAEPPPAPPSFPPFDLGEGPAEDEPPFHATPARSRAKAGKAPRVTAATRKDIEAKVGLMLELPGRVWAARDPYCGGVFVNSIPEVRPALTELICQSADLVEWFTGVGGGFMLWLNLMAALQPVAVTIWAHHITHAIGEGVEPQAQDARQYAA